MIGSNTMNLNEATILAALQEYFDKRTTLEGRFSVCSVSKTANGFAVGTKAIERMEDEEEESDGDE